MHFQLCSGLMPQSQDFWQIFWHLGSFSLQDLRATSQFLIFSLTENSRISGKLVVVLTFFLCSIVWNKCSSKTCWNTSSNYSTQAGTLLILQSVYIWSAETSAPTRLLACPVTFKPLEATISALSSGVEPGCK